MTDMYPMVHPSTFISNPLIAKIADDKYWTVSDDEKRPINAVALLHDHTVKNVRFDEGWPLVSLKELDSDKMLEAVNRAYRLRARDNRVIVVDVEPVAPNAMKADVMNFPAHFTELSRNGGVHLLIEVPEDLITDTNRYMFEELSVFKEPVPKVPKGEKERPAHYEVLFNDHFITFTKRMATQKPCVDYATNPEAKEQLRAFLKQIEDLDLQRKKDREITKKYRIQMLDEQFTEEKKANINKFIGMSAFNATKQDLMHKTADDFGGDQSRYEMSVATTFAHSVLKYHKMAKDTLTLRTLAMSLRDQDLAYATYLLLKDAVPYREKHDEEREDLPWLVYTSKNAYEFAKGQRANRQKTEKR